ncbi:hypothetical protein Gbth_011_041 [Gluconobacter thailandicus F149-1 = NBRC 100600]|uniref:Hedgehog/Intein (Hint) domain-containing protein n=1 Tax=Gluconobacter thailandicus NBRC 3257 TaxID=1381097 RepID=A0ABQ0IVJ5_GLUTH|nr:Hint domain-containing protein [Gluconobacter thailandicus]GAN89755.1 hypothetical protein Gbfr_007_212 [Gluconobacter frateurii M-2]KXV53926.1 hypothetical protein AD946_05345 [Gluconobacter thailandicus]GAC88900.1 hypothetical protein NBRC3255_2561 [Gluconobacter thailandicus NBRC 3255]GAD26229.1 hypothetical protein NBRC3257_1228 [Gluconobacter thailandicus NBRC 3257]GAN92539.1 hypothetical protein Gbth_011_041 [Gluconobacter thailandicus F149-1 = NBRC 100600]
MSISSDILISTSVLTVSSGGQIQSLSGDPNPTEIPAGTTVSGGYASGITQTVAGSAVGFTVKGQDQPYNFNNMYYPGLQIVQSGGVVIDTNVIAETYRVGGAFNSSAASGTQIVLNGGSALNTTLQGEEYIVTAGMRNPYILSINSAVQHISSGGYASGINVQTAGVSIVSAGGYATGTTISGVTKNLALYNINTNPMDVAYPVQISGEQIVYGTSEDVTLLSDGLLDVTGIARHVTVSSGGELIGENDATLSDITVRGGGIIMLGSSTTFTDPITVQSSAVFIFNDIDNSSNLVSAAVVSTSGTSGTLEVISAGTVVQDLAIQGDFSSPLYFTKAASGNRFEMGFGTPCYCPGTLIATETEELPIEELKIGTPVRTASGQLRPISWIGRRSYDPIFAYGNRDVLPILIRKGALGNNLPRRDLTVSPLHAMFLDGYLIPALHLVNDLTIIQIEKPNEINYIHLELETHDILLAEGAPSESFLDDSSRGMFHNAHEYNELYPDAPVMPPQYCAPRLEDGAELARIHQRLKNYAQQVLSEKAA